MTVLPVALKAGRLWSFAGTPPIWCRRAPAVTGHKSKFRSPVLSCLPSCPINPAASGRGVTAVLGPTNTGKTHLAIERMAAHSTGLIGLPLRLLAREVYQRLCEKVGVANVALITGEEKINPGTPNRPVRYQVCTVEAMPSETNAAFVAIDEVQIAADLERGHIFTDRLMNLRGREETMLLGAATVEHTLRALLPGLHVITRPRMSMLDYAGSKKITRLPPRSAIVAFSANEVYAIAELIRRQRGGAAVVLGSLSPRTRNAQVALYQSGDVDFLVATDAIGMGLNLDLDHVAFAQDKKFDGFRHRRLTPAEMGQIAGRAGRHTKNGTFGVTGQVQPLEDELVERLVTHEFEPTKVLTWRNRELDFSSLENLVGSLEAPSANRLLMKSFPASDLVGSGNPGPRRLDCGYLQPAKMPSNCFGMSAAFLITARFRPVIMPASCKTCMNRSPERERSMPIGLPARSNGLTAPRAILTPCPAGLPISEPGPISATGPIGWIMRHTGRKKHATPRTDLSDALHEALTKRFIDRRTSVLMKKLRENTHMEAEIKPNGDVEVEGHLVGQLNGFRFKPDTAGESPEAKAANAAAMKTLAGEIEKRAGRLSASANTDFILSKDAVLRWQGDPVAKLAAGEDVLKPRIILLADEQLTGPARDSVVARLERWIANHVANVLKPLVEMSGDQTLEGMARGVAFRLIEALGNIDRREIHSDVQGLSQDMRAGLRRHGVRFGAYTIFFPALLKPAPAELLCLLWGLKNDRLEAPGMDEIPQILASGRTSTVHNPDFDNEIYRLCGYRILGAKAVRVDILERLADLIRPALYWKAPAPVAQTSDGDDGKAPEKPALDKPEGAIDGRSFYVTPAMMSILGATHEDMELILKGLGYRGEPRLESEIKPEAEAAKPPLTPQAPAKPHHDIASQDEPSASSVENADAAATADPIQADGDTSDAATNAPAEGAADNAVDEKTASGSDQAPEAEEGPKTILVWRQAPKPNRGNQRHRGKAASGEDGNRNQKPGEKRYPEHRDKGKPGGKFGEKSGGKPGGRQKNFSARPPRPPKEQKIDPDSPFAKLAALKNDLKDNLKKGE